MIECWLWQGVEAPDRAQYLTGMIAKPGVDLAVAEPLEGVIVCGFRATVSPASGPMGALPATFS
jgi:hypothetical protein